jgi:hypothetical protein
MERSQDHAPTDCAVASGHTPGPWEWAWEWAVDSHERRYLKGDGLCVLCPELSEPDHPQAMYTEAWLVVSDANARLIAAAPTMADYIAKRAAAGDAEAARIMEVIRGHA